MRETDGNRLSFMNRVSVDVGGALAIHMIFDVECKVPTGLDTSNVGQGSVLLTWDNLGVPFYTVVLSVDDPEVEDLTFTTTAPRLQIRDLLLQGTEYSWTVTAHCDATNYETEEGPSFTTLPCLDVVAITELPMARSFSVADVSPMNPGDDFVCWKQDVIAEGSTRTPLWRRLEFMSHIGQNHTRNRLIAMSTSGSADGDRGAIVKLISPVYDLSVAAEFPENGWVLKLDVLFSERQEYDTLKVYRRTSETGAWMLLGTFPSVRPEPLISAGWREISVPFPANPGAYNQFAFEAIHAGGHGMGIDQIWIDTLPMVAVITGRTPQIDAENVSVASAVNITFNRMISVGPAGTAGIVLNDEDGNNIATGIVFDGQVLRIQHAGLFDTTTYTVVIPDEAILEYKEGEINWSFTTGYQAPTIGAFEPIQATTMQQVELITTPIRVTITGRNIHMVDSLLDSVSLRPVTGATLNSASPWNQIWTEGEFGTPLDIDVELVVVNDNQKNLVIIPRNGLQENTMYEVYFPNNFLHYMPVNASIRPPAMGGYASSPWRFRTTIQRALADHDDNRLPRPGATNVALDAAVSIELNGSIIPVNDTSLDLIQIFSIIGTDTTALPNVSSAIDPENANKIIIQHPGFAEGVRYRVFIPTGIVMGQPTAAAWSWIFTATGGSSIVGLTENGAVVVIYPNPVSDELFIQTENRVIAVEIFNLQGQLIKRLTSDASSVSVSDLPIGIYILKVTTDDGIVTQRFVKN